MTKTTTALTDDLQFGADETRNAAPDDKDDKFLWGAKAIAEEIDAELRPTFHMLEQVYLPATKVGRVWMTSRSRLRQFFDDKIAAAAAAETGMPAMPSKARVLKRLGKRKHQQPEPLK
jgi:hypothetical protein